jgi:Ca2+-binding RTX toxin-like protein
MRRTRVYFLVGLAVAIATALNPASASAVEIRTQQVLIGVLILEAKKSFVNEVGVSWVVSPSGAPDVVIGDTAAGIPDPIPAPCARVDPMIARCPASSFNRLQVDLGAGNDVFVAVKPAVGINGFITMEVSLGTGIDQVSDLGNTRDTFRGGPGRDQLSSGPLNDLVKGGAQNDRIDCGSGRHDVGVGGPGKDLGKNCEVVKH